MIEVQFWKKKRLINIEIEEYYIKLNISDRGFGWYRSQESKEYDIRYLIKWLNTWILSDFRHSKCSRLIYMTFIIWWLSVMSQNGRKWNEYLTPMCCFVMNLNGNWSWMIFFLIWYHSFSPREVFYGDSSTWSACKSWWSFPDSRSSEYLLYLLFSWEVMM